MQSSNNSSTWKLLLATLGVVYGDIGTSPLYVLKECFHPHYGLSLTPENILGICSLVFWSLLLVVGVKYSYFILKADNQGEGGPMSLLALLTPKQGYKTIPITIMLALAATALLVSEGIITPAISVLSAVEGIEFITPVFKPYVVVITVLILGTLFFFQKKGTATVGGFFGPITFTWFLMLSIIGIYWIVQNPIILKAVNPYYAFNFFIMNKTLAILVLGSVMLCITGGEALYADMSHVGKNNIVKTWWRIVYPALALSYFGQGALLLQHPEAVNNPFYNSVGGFMIYPAVLIATLATIVASQALISGSYSITQQAIKLGFFPRLKILYTSRENEGQIYIPHVNNFLMVGCLLMVIIMQESSKLAGAYGISVILTMTISTILFFKVTRVNWKWPLYKSLSFLLFFLTIDLFFLAGNIVKIPHGGWISLLMAFIIFWVMLTWKKGRMFLSETFKKRSAPLDEFISSLLKDNPHRIPGMGVYMTIGKNLAPFVLVQNYKHNRVLHEKVLLLSIVTDNKPEVLKTKKLEVQALADGFYKVVAHYGYMENPKVMDILAQLQEDYGLTFNFDELSFYLGRENIVTTGWSNLFIWSKKLFVILNRNTQPATDFFKLPPERVIEIGGQVEI